MASIQIPSMSNFFRSCSGEKLSSRAALYHAARIHIQIGRQFYRHGNLPIGTCVWWSALADWVYDSPDLTGLTDRTAQGSRATPTVSVPERIVVPQFNFAFHANWRERSAAGRFSSCRAPSSQDRKSIAVLPFQNRAIEKQNAFSPDGCRDDILTKSMKIGDMKVIRACPSCHIEGGRHAQRREIGAKNARLWYSVEGAFAASQSFGGVMCRLRCQQRRATSGRKIQTAI